MGDMNFIRIMTALSDNGFAPCLINNDNGLWCVTDEGLTKAPFQEDKSSTHEEYIICDYAWFESDIESALSNYLDRGKIDSKIWDNVSE